MIDCFLKDEKRQTYKRQTEKDRCRAKENLLVETVRFYNSMEIGSLI